MDRNTIILLATVFSKFIFGQASYSINDVFHGLPIEEQSPLIQKILLSDKRFYSTHTSEDVNKSMYTYTGYAKDNGVILSKSDSVLIHLTYASNSSFKEINNAQAIGKRLTILRLEYYYSLPETVEKEYRNILNILKPLISDTILTFQSHSSDTRFYASGMTFKDNMSKYRIEVLKASFKPNVFALLIEYVREETGH